MAIGIATEIIQRKVNNNLFNNIWKKKTLKSYERNLRPYTHKKSLKLYI